MTVAATFTPLDVLLKQMGMERAEPQPNQVRGTSLFTLPGQPPTQRSQRPAAAGSASAPSPRPPAVTPKPGGYLEQQLAIARARGTLPAAGGSSRLAQMDLVSQQQEQDSGPWWKKLASKTLGNQVVSTALAPLDALQVGGRAVITGVEHAARALPEEAEWLMPITKLIDEEKSRADSRSVLDRIKGEDGYGFGQVMHQIDTGYDGLDKWANRVGGFAGDVLLDPLTYLTAGTSKAAGKTARLSAAARAASEGMGDDVVRKLATIGPSTLSAEQRAALGLEQAGLRFAGKRIAGTGGVANAVGRAQGTVRHAVTRTRPWQVVASHPQRIEQASRVLATGKPIGNMTPTQAALVVGFDEQWRMASRLVESQANETARRVFKGKGERERIALAHATEAGDPSPLRDLFQDLRRQAVEAGVSIGDLGPDFVPHVFTDGALDFLGKRGASDRWLRDATDVGGTLKGRKLRGGVVKVGDTTVDMGDGSIAAINAGMTRAFPDAGVSKWLEDDSARLVGAYAANIGDAIGTVKAFRYLTNAKADVARPLDDVADEVLDRVATHTANRELRNALRGELKQRRQAYKIEAARAAEDAAELQTVLVGFLDDEIARLGRQGDKLRGVLTGLRQRGRTLAGERKRLGAVVADMRTDAERKVGAATERIKEIDGRLQAAAVRGVPLERMRLEGQRQRLAAELTEAQRQLDAIGEVDEAMQASIASSAELAGRASDPDYVNGLRRALDAQDFQDRLDAAAVEFEQITKRADAQPVGAALGIPDEMPTSTRQPTTLETRIREQHPELADELAEINQQTEMLRGMLTAAGRQYDQAKRRVAELRQLAQANRSLNTAKDDVRRTFDQLDRIVNELPDSPELAGAFAIHSAFAEKVARLDAAAMSVDQTRKFLKAAKDGKLTRVFELQARDGWERVAETVLPPDAPIAVRQEIADSLKRLEVANQSGELWATIGNLTAAWRTWAVSTPGFTVRNLMGATMMNIADGVKLADHKAAAKAWREYIADPETFLKRAAADDPQMYDALSAVVGSGSFGSWSPEYLGQSSRGMKVPRVLVDNPWTRKLRRGGEHSEGVVRLAAALNTTRNGGDAAEALARVTRLHFSYVDLGKADRAFKAALPFSVWLRNALPLMLQMTFMRPRVLRAYDHFVDNMGGLPRNTPSWLVGSEGFPITEPDSEGGPYWAVAPDLPWTGLQDDWSPRGLSSAVNPILSAPVEALANVNMYTQRPIGDEGDRLTHLVQRLFPDVGRVQRMTGALGGERYSGQHPQRIANWLGVPVYEVTRDQQEREARRRQREAANG